MIVREEDRPRGIGEQIFGLSLTGFFLSTCSAALEGTVKLYCKELRRLGVSVLRGGVLRRVRMLD